MARAPRVLPETINPEIKEEIIMTTETETLPEAIETLPETTETLPNLITRLATTHLAETGTQTITHLHAEKITLSVFKNISDYLITKYLALDGNGKLKENALKKDYGALLQLRVIEVEIAGLVSTFFGTSAKYADKNSVVTTVHCLQPASKIFASADSAILFATCDPDAVNAVFKALPHVPTIEELFASFPHVSSLLNVGTPEAVNSDTLRIIFQSYESMLDFKAGASNWTALHYMMLADQNLHYAPDNSFNQIWDTDTATLDKYKVDRHSVVWSLEVKLIPQVAPVTTIAATDETA